MYPTAEIVEQIGGLAMGLFGWAVGGLVLGGIVAWVALTIWSKILSLEMKKNAKPIRPEER